MNNRFYTCLKSGLLLCTVPLLIAWVDPVDINKDNESVPSSTKNTLSLNINSTTADLDRCDTAATAYTDAVSAIPIPRMCHRWNLVWAPIVETPDPDTGENILAIQADWAPNVAGDNWRLPTIKELTKLINFGEKNTDTLIESATIKNWFTQSVFWDNTNDQYIDTSNKNVWLISSTYRDIDNNDGDNALEPNLRGQAQVFAINILNGEIKTFEPGYKSTSMESGSEVVSYGLRLCQSLLESGACSDPIAPADPVIENIVFALKVNTQTVSQ